MLDSIDGQDCVPFHAAHPAKPPLCAAFDEKPLGANPVQSCTLLAGSLSMWLGNRIRRLVCSLRPSQLEILEVELVLLVRAPATH